MRRASRRSSQIADKHDGMFDVVQAREYPLLDKVALQTQVVPKYKDCAAKVYQCIRIYCRANDIDLAVSVVL